MKKKSTKTVRPANLDALLEKDLAAVRKVCERLPNGRTQLAQFLGIRLSEVGRYLKVPPGRSPNGPVLAGMRAFVWKHTRKVNRPTIKTVVFEGNRPSELHCGECKAMQVLPAPFKNGRINQASRKTIERFLKTHQVHAKK